MAEKKNHGKKEKSWQKRNHGRIKQYYCTDKYNGRNYDDRLNKLADKS